MNTDFENDHEMQIVIQAWDSFSQPHQASSVGEEIGEGGRPSLSASDGEAGRPSLSASDEEGGRPSLSASDDEEGGRQTFS